ncbi:nitrogenase component 1 [uncultured Mitsuokella sp.]|uniref:nitrogenase component 1 n=1 Tax=uncultured Mitsuokella sp. TaxID=453120 RepID=UPI00266F6A0A|nr:nitrogenase component 1 [uncultured Mitsuokella sp.]
MLKRISPTLSSASSEAGSPAKAAPAPVLLRDASFPAPFAHGLEYSPPCRGTWNIVHTGMQIPETHQIFICASGCLRGVVLTAAEMGLMGRFSSIELHENDLTGRDNEMLIIEGVADILARLPQKPRAVLLYPACVHHFLGCNLRYVYKELRRRFPDIAFAECFMDPIRQTRHLTPEERLRRALGRLLPEHLPKERQVSIFGSNRKTSPASDFIQLLQKNGWQVRDMANCASYDEFLQLGSSRLNLCINPFSLPAVHDMKKRLQQDFLYLPQVWSMQEITALLAELAQKIGAGPQDFTALQARADEALKKAQAVIGSTPISLDFTFTFRPFGLARLLLSYGFAVTRIYADAVSSEEEQDFRWLQEHHGAAELWPTKAAAMRVLPRPAQPAAPKNLALGQKAAYFSNTPYFVNEIEGGGIWGFAALVKLAGDMTAAYQTPKDIEANVSHKGLGGPCIL